MNIQNWSKNTGSFGKRLFRLRGYTPYPIVLLFFFLAQPTPSSFAAGIFWVIAGEILRIWSVAYTGKETRQHIINTPKLAIGGPYAFVRNPIYIGNLIIYSGVTIIANLWLPFFLFFVWLYFGLQYIFIVRAEENALQSAFGAAYDRYRQAVPAWLPALKPYPGERETADYREAFRSESSTFWSIAGFLGVLIWRMNVINQSIG